MFGENNDSDDGSTDGENNGDGMYSFLGQEPDEAEQEAADEEQPSILEAHEPEQERRWTLGDHTTADDETATDIEAALASVDDDVDADLRAVLEEAAGLVSEASVSGFECPVCGLNHTHPDHKHDIRSPPKKGGFRVRAEFADELEFNPYCHCGVNELAMLVDFIGYINVAVFEDQEQFESAFALTNNGVIEYCRARRELEAETDITEVVTFDDVLREAGLYGEVTDTSAAAQTAYQSALEAFYSRWLDIKQSANKAPIAGETRSAIDNLRSAIEADLGLGDEPENAASSGMGPATGDTEAEDDDRPEGVIAFFNSAGGYGFIETGAVEEDVFFHVDDVGTEGIAEGVTVAFEYLQTDKGPKATSVEVLDEQ